MWFVLQPISLHSFTCTKIRTNNKMVKIVTTILIGTTIFVIQEDGIHKIR